MSLLRCALGFVFACLISACTTSPPARVQAWPQQLVFGSTPRQLEVALHNSGNTPATVSGFRVTGPQWDAFSIVEPLDTVELSAGDALRFHISLDKGALPQQDGRRGGVATFHYTVDGKPLKLPLRLEPRLGAVPLLGLALGKLGLLATLAAAPLALLLFSRRRISAQLLAAAFKEDFVPRHAHRPLFFAAPALAWITAVVSLAVLPFGDALCPDLAWDVVSQADLEQCAAHRGGTPLAVAQLDTGILFWLATMLGSSVSAWLAGWSSGNRWAVYEATDHLRRAIPGLTALALAIAAVAVTYGTIHPRGLVLAQTTVGWGAWRQPLAGAIVLWACSASTTRASPNDAYLEHTGLRRAIVAVADACRVVSGAVVFTTLFLGGWTLPFGMLTASGFSAPWVAVLSLLASAASLAGFGIRRLAHNGHASGVVALLAAVLIAAASIVAWMNNWGTALPHYTVVGLNTGCWLLKVCALCILHKRFAPHAAATSSHAALGPQAWLFLAAINLILTLAVLL